MADSGRRRRRRGGRERAGQERPQGNVGDRDYGRDRDPRQQGDKDRPTPAEKTNKDKEVSVTAVPATKPTIILAKPPERKDSSSAVPPVDKTPVVMIKARDETKQTSQTGSVPTATPAPGEVSHSDAHHQVYQLHRHSNAPAPGEGVIQSQQLPRLSTPPEMTHSMKLVDDSLQWCDNGTEMLLDQTDYLVVGVIGLQGTGKSTVMSLIAGNAFEDNPRMCAFRQQSRDVKEIAGHQTHGIDFMVTSERIILLDTQPILSASVLDQLIKHEKSLPPEITTAENCVELQSLQLAAFLFTVCHVVLVIQDWTEDINMLQFIHRAEMLKPPTPSPSVESSAGASEDNDDFYPQIVFVHNKATREDFKLDNIQQANSVISVVLKHSKLKYKGCMSLTHSKLLPHMDSDLPDTDVNLFLIPKAGSAGKSNDSKGITSLIPEYKGHPGLENIVTALRNLIFSASRTPLAHTSLTEKNWFHYAARTWDGVKKSNLMSEYSRLL